MRKEQYQFFSVATVEYSSMRSAVKEHLKVIKTQRFNIPQIFRHIRGNLDSNVALSRDELSLHGSGKERDRQKNDCVSHHFRVGNGRHQAPPMWIPFVNASCGALVHDMVLSSFVGHWTNVGMCH